MSAWVCAPLSKTWWKAHFLFVRSLYELIKSHIYPRVTATHSSFADWSSVTEWVFTADLGSQSAHVCTVFECIFVSVVQCLWASMSRFILFDKVMGVVDVWPSPCCSCVSMLYVVLFVCVCVSEIDTSLTDNQGRTALEILGEHPAPKSQQITALIQGNTHTHACCRFRWISLEKLGHFSSKK